MIAKLKEWVFGKAKNPLDEEVFHKLSLVAFLAWVGMGADGLSSSAYGPDECFRALAGSHALALYLAVAITFTVFIISASYSQIIEHFPSGGGGYVVASKLLGERAGVVSGSALVVDYVLTIAISIAAGVDAVFSLQHVPASWAAHKLAAEVGLTVFLMWLNLRGIKESIQTLLPIFLLFVATHALLLGVGVFTHVSNLVPVGGEVVRETRNIVGLPGGWWLLTVMLFRAYSLGGGTYTGIEAVSNGLANLREPRVRTGKRTMLYMATSLALTAGGIMLCYMLWHVQVVPNKTLNAVLAEQVFGGWSLAGWPVGWWLVFLTMASEGMLLFIAAQTGFVDGPNVLSSMAVDSWVPHRFANLSNRLVRNNGVLVMGLSALLILWLTGGNVDVLVVLYSINVFLTFSLSQLSMCRHWYRERKSEKGWWRHFLINGTGMALTATILVATLMIKFTEGGWVTMVITGGFILACALVKSQYHQVKLALKRLDDMLANLPFPDSDAAAVPEACDPQGPTAVLMVKTYEGLGIHSIFSIQKLFRQQFKNFIFVSVGRIDSSKFKGVEEIENLKHATEEGVSRYVELARKMGYCSTGYSSLSTDVLTEMEKLCEKIAGHYVDPVFFCGKLVFAREGFINRILHNQTSMELQRRLLFKGFNMVVVPIRVLEYADNPA